MQGCKTEAYQEVANAIVLQAVTDYRNALMGKSYCGKSAEDVVSELESFFRSTYFALLTKVPGVLLIEKLREEVEDEDHIDSTDTQAD